MWCILLLATQTPLPALAHGNAEHKGTVASVSAADVRIWAKSIVRRVRLADLRYCYGGDEGCNFQELFDRILREASSLFI